MADVVGLNFAKDLSDNRETIQLIAKLKMTLLYTFVPLTPCQVSMQLITVLSFNFSTEGDATTKRDV